MPWRIETYGRSRNGVKFVKEKTLAYSHKSKVNIESSVMFSSFHRVCRQLLPWPTCETISCEWSPHVPRSKLNWISPDFKNQPSLIRHANSTIIHSMSGACKRFERPGREGLGLDGRALGTVTRSHLSASGSIDQSEQYQVWQRVAIDIYRERYVRRSLASLYRNRVWSAKYYTKKFVYLNYPLKFFQELLYRKRLKTRNNPLANKYFRGRYFSSCSEWGQKKKTLSSYEKSNPRILRSDALPLSHRDSGEKKPKKV